MVLEVRIQCLVVQKYNKKWNGHLLCSCTRKLRDISEAKDGMTQSGQTLVTDFVPSDMACFASSPGRMSRTDVWISRDEMVDFFEYAASSNKA
jgi:hypothetical protein